MKDKPCESNDKVLNKVFKQAKQNLGEEGEEYGGWFDKNGNLINPIRGDWQLNILDEEVGIPKDAIGSFHTHPFSGKSDLAPNKLRFSEKDKEFYEAVNSKKPCMIHIVIGEDGFLRYEVIKNKKK